MPDFDKNDWCWALEDGRVWSTKTAAFADQDAVDAWLAGSGLTEIPPAPADEAGEASEAGLRAALVFYGLPLGELATVEMKMAAIDAETTAAIVAGFDYEAQGQALHFSYDPDDQQNFADMANVATLAQQGVPNLPDSFTWNGWNIERDTEGNETSRSLVRLVLTLPEFLGLYLGGALTHKATQMEIGSRRKAARRISPRGLSGGTAGRAKSRTRWVRPVPDRF